MAVVDFCAGRPRAHPSSRGFVLALLVLLAPAASAGADDRVEALGLEGEATRHVLATEAAIDDPFEPAVGIAARAGFDWQARVSEEAGWIAAYLGAADEDGHLEAIDAFFATEAGRAYAEARREVATLDQGDEAARQSIRGDRAELPQDEAVARMERISELATTLAERQLAPAYAARRLAVAEVLAPAVGGPLAEHAREEERLMELTEDGPRPSDPRGPHQDAERWLELERERAEDPASVAPTRDLIRLMMGRLGQLTNAQIDAVEAFYETDAAAWLGEAMAAAAGEVGERVATERVAHMRGISDRVAGVEVDVEDDAALLAFVEPFVDASFACRPKDPVCFASALSDCREAAATFSMHRVAYRYEILGPEDGACRVRMSFPANPNPEWVDQPMTCAMPASPSLSDLQGAHEDLLEDNPYACEGPLVEIIRDM